MVLARLDFKLHLAVGRYASLGFVSSRDLLWYVSRLCDLASRFVTKYWTMPTNGIPYHIALCGSLSVLSALSHRSSF